MPTEWTRTRSSPGPGERRSPSATESCHGPPKTSCRIAPNLYDRSRRFQRADVLAFAELGALDAHSVLRQRRHEDGDAPAPAALDRVRRARPRQLGRRRHGVLDAEADVVQALALRVELLR